MKTKSKPPEKKAREFRRKEQTARKRLDRYIQFKEQTAGKLLGNFIRRSKPLEID